MDVAIPSPPGKGCTKGGCFFNPLAHRERGRGEGGAPAAILSCAAPYPSRHGQQKVELSSVATAGVESEVSLWKGEPG
ncbi:hypothetical protein GMPD_03190 [Geomonas paludis]|uniref:Uncharacterized protein n=1 Tax=Geomonas paludis TaxID=2740185 RepID=A0A6V8MQR4_9BACT|nr:hypothetical protein GMPD_03190 [Geomonas paludis]